jgi:DNA-binding Xre family transcriptional regulator
MQRTITYQWHLAEQMARLGMHNSTALLPHLRERGIDLSPSQIYRLVTGKPERVSLHFLVALCDIFSCELPDLVTYTSSARPQKKVVAGNVVDLNKSVRPKRARIIPDAD